MNLVSNFNERGGAFVQRNSRPRCIVAFSPDSSSRFIGGLLDRSDVPSCRAHWRNEFCNWISKRFEGSRVNGADLFPEEGTLEWQLQELADMVALKERFSLSDPLVHSFWMEYLSEHSARVDWWRRFLRLNGPCDTL